MKPTGKLRGISLSLGLRIAISTAVATAMAIAMVAALAPRALAKDKPDLTWDHYYDQQMVTDALKSMHESYPRLTELQSLGLSAEKREIWALTINNPRTGADTDKPGIYVDGAIHGNEIQATEVCLYLAWYLLTSYGELERITALVDSTAIYIVPTVNVDSRARFFSDPGGYNIGRTARQPHDDDHDGLADEDDYEDIDGDGEILSMRIRDPFGDWRSDPDDPRVMLRIKPGEKGEWRLLGREGMDNDGDGQVNEDPPGYLDMNRNWGFQWQPRYVQGGAGDYPFSTPNTRAISEFILSKPSICFGFAFHNYGGMFLRGPGSELSPPYSSQDTEVYDYLGAEGERTVPGYRYLVSSQDLYKTYGDFDEFMYQCLGIYGLVGELFMTSQLQFKRKGDVPTQDEDPYWQVRPSQKERQKFNDRLMMGEMFKDWTPFAHPTYGQIEIGGWRPFAVRTPPAFMIPEMVHRNAAFVIWTASQLPRVGVEVTEVKPLGDGLFRVRARAANSGALPTLSHQARLRRIHPLDRFELSGREVQVLSGGVLVDEHFDSVEPVEHRPRFVPTFVPAFGKRDVQWIVAGRGEITVTYEGVKTGRREAQARLR